MNINGVRADNVQTHLIEGGARREWLAKSADDLIRMFASHGFVILPCGKDANGDFTVNPGAPGFREQEGIRDVRHDGRQVACILWHKDVPDFARAVTDKASNNLSI